MHSPAGGGARFGATRRRHLERRRRAAFAIGLSVIVLAVVAAYAVPTPTSAPLSAKADAIVLGSPTADDPVRVVVAELEGAQLCLPVQRDLTTAIVFHPADDPNAVAFTPIGDHVAEGGVAGVPAGDAALQYHLMDGTGDERGPSTSGLDVGGVPGSEVYAPVDGQVVTVRTYSLLGSHRDCEIDIQLASDPSLLVILTHIVAPVAHVGDRVAAGVTVLGRLRGFPSGVPQDIRRYTNDAGDHVQLIALRVTPDLATF